MTTEELTSSSYSIWHQSVKLNLVRISGCVKPTLLHLKLREPVIPVLIWEKQKVWLILYVSIEEQHSAFQLGAFFPAVRLKKQKKKKREKET